MHDVLGETAVFLLPLPVGERAGVRSTRTIDHRTFSSPLSLRHAPRKRSIQYATATSVVTGSSACADDDAEAWAKPQCLTPRRAARRAPGRSAPWRRSLRSARCRPGI